MKILRNPFFLGLIFLSALDAFAQAPIVVSPVVVFNSFGAGNTYSTAVVWAVSGASTSGGYRGQAEFFTSAVSGYLSSMTLATYHVSGSSLSNFTLAEDNGSGAPGSILETFSNVSNPTGLLTLNSAADPLLQAGTQYWLCDEPATATSYNGWYYNNQGRANGFAFERSQWSWAAIPSPAPNSGVFSVSVLAVPEPTVLAFLMTGGIFLCGRIKRAAK